MSDTDCRKAFDRFYRSPDAASKPGMGRATYVRLLVEAHNGTVAVESRQATAHVSPSLFHNEHTDKNCFVDDDVRNAGLLRRFLEAEGYEVAFAANGREGYDIYKTFSPILYSST